MGKVYVKTRAENSVVWAPLEEGILRCLEDPLKQGLYYLQDKDEPRGEIVLQHSAEQRLPNGRWIPFASNLGFSTDYSCTSRIISPDGREAYLIIQLSDGYIIDHIKRGGRVKMSFLVPNMLKLMDSGRYFIFDGPYEEVSGAIRARGYKFVEPNEGELQTKWFFRLRDEVLEQRKRLVTDEFVEMVNKEYFKLSPVTQEGLLKLLTHVDISN